MFDIFFSFFKWKQIGAFLWDFSNVQLANIMNCVCKNEFESVNLDLCLLNVI